MKRFVSIHSALGNENKGDQKKKSTFVSKRHVSSKASCNIQFLCLLLLITLAIHDTDFPSRVKTFQLHASFLLSCLLTDRDFSVSTHWGSKPIFALKIDFAEIHTCLLKYLNFYTIVFKINEMKYLNFRAKNQITNPCILRLKIQIFY